MAHCKLAPAFTTLYITCWELLIEFCKIASFNLLIALMYANHRIEITVARQACANYVTRKGNLQYERDKSIFAGISFTVESTGIFSVIIYMENFLHSH